MTEGLEDGAEWGVLTIRIPPELKGYEPEMAKFLDAMVFKLRRNAHKGKWETVPMALALERLDDEMGELRSAVVNGSTMEILMESADVANMALIVANISLEVRGKEKEKEQSITPWGVTHRNEGWAIGRIVDGKMELWGGPMYFDHRGRAQDEVNELNGAG